MASKTTVIFTLRTLNGAQKMLWAFDISEPQEIRTLWMNEVFGNVRSTAAANGQVFLLTGNPTPKVDIYSPGSGTLLKSVNLAPWDPTWWIFEFLDNPLRTIEHECRVMPIRSRKGHGFSIYVLDLKEEAFINKEESWVWAVENHFWMGTLKWIGPDDLVVRASPTVYKFMNWKDAPEFRQIRPGENYSLQASVKPNGQLVTVQSNASKVACFFDLLDKGDDQTDIRRKRIKGRKFKTSTSVLHHGNLIDYSGFKKKGVLTFTSFAPSGRASEVKKPIQTPEGFGLVSIRCISTAAVAHFWRPQTQGKEAASIFKILDFKP